MPVNETFHQRGERSRACAPAPRAERGTLGCCRCCRCPRALCREMQAAMHNGIDIGLFLDKVSSKKGVLNPKETLKGVLKPKPEERLQKTSLLVA